MNWLDLWQAINDIALQLIVTLVFLIILFAVGLYFSWLSHRKRNKQQPTRSERIGLRVKLRRPQAKVTQEPSSWWSDFWQGISTEFFGAVVTTILLGLGVLIFEQYQDMQNHKAELILQMGSPDNGFAIEATRQLITLGWIEDGTLINADLRGADLSGANLSFANLQGASFDSANLHNADLSGANLSFVNLYSTNLSGVNLMGANLEIVTLPDGSVWSTGDDVSRFTNPDHPDFWNPCIEVGITLSYCE